MLSEPFGRALKAGRKVAPKPPPVPRGPRAPRGPNKTDYNTALREYADAHGLRNPKNPNQPIYRTSSGRSIWYPEKLEKMFAADHPDKAKALGEMAFS